MRHFTTTTHVPDVIETELDFIYSQKALLAMDIANVCVFIVFFFLTPCHGQSRYQCSMLACFIPLQRISFWHYLLTQTHQGIYSTFTTFHWHHGHLSKHASSWVLGVGRTGCYQSNGASTAEAVKSIKGHRVKEKTKGFLYSHRAMCICMATEFNMSIIPSIQAPFLPTNVCVTSQRAESHFASKLFPGGACRAVKLRSRQSVAPRRSEAPRPSSSVLCLAAPPALASETQPKAEQARILCRTP